MKYPQLETIGERLKYYGQMTYGTLGEFAKKLEIRQNALSEYISGRRTPGAEFREKLKNLDAPVVWIMSGIEEDIPSVGELDAKRDKLKTEFDELVKQQTLISVDDLKEYMQLLKEKNQLNEKKEKAIQEIEKLLLEAKQDNLARAAAKVLRDNLR